MIQIDDRTGSDRLGASIRKRKVKTDMCRLDFGDAAFIGSGPGGRPVSVGIEYKIVSDALKCITDGRFAGHQLIGLTQSYEVVILLLEGRTRPDAREGLLQVQHDKGYWYDARVGQRSFMYHALDNWLLTLSFKAGIRVIRTGNLDESAAAVIDLFRWWTDKEYEAHRSHLALVDDLNDRVSMIRPNIVRRMAKELPGVGWDRSNTVSKRFRTPMDMCMADERDWSALDGIGKKTAQGIIRAIQEGK